MIQRAKWKLLTAVIRACFLGSGRQPAAPDFVRELPAGKSRPPVTGDVYTVHRGGVTRHRNETGVGSPVLRETYNSLPDFALAFIDGHLFAQTHELALRAASRPESAPCAEVRHFLKTNPVGAYGRDLSAITQEVTKMLARRIYEPVDTVLKGPGPRLLGWCLFRGTLSRDDALATLLEGEWVSGDERRRYGEETLRVGRAPFDSSSFGATCRWRINDNVGGMLVLRVFPEDDELCWDERLLVTRDGRTLIVFDHAGRKLFRRAGRA